MKITIGKQRALEMVQDLDSGFKIYINNNTGETRSVVNSDLYMSGDNGMMEDDQTEIDSWKDRTYIEPPQSYEALEFKESFLPNIIDCNLKKELEDALYKRGPFVNFNDLVESSNYREDWFSHKSKCVFNYLKHQLDLSGIQIEEE